MSNDEVGVCCDDRDRLPATAGRAGDYILIQMYVSECCCVRAGKAPMPTPTKGTGNVLVMQYPALLARLATGDDI